MEVAATKCEISGGSAPLDRVVADANALRRAARAWVKQRLPADAPLADLPRLRLALREDPQLFDEMRAQFPDLLKTYPLVCNMLIVLDQYDTRVFENYLRTLQGHNPWATRETWLESQTEYAVALYRHSHPRAAAREVAEYRANVTQSLKADDDVFREAAELAQKEVDEIARAETVRRRDRLVQQALRRRAAELGVDPAPLAAAIGAARAARDQGVPPLEFGAALFADDAAAYAALERLCAPAR